MDHSSENVEFQNEVWDYQGAERVSLSGNFSKHELKNELQGIWIPYMECYKCGKSDYCKWSATNSLLSTDIQCGVACSALSNLLDISFPIIKTTSNEKKQYWLDGAYHWTLFVYKSEIQIGGFLDKGIIEFLGKFAPGFFGQTKLLREHLDGISSNFQSFPEFKSTERVLFVEGWSEKAFIEKMKESRLMWFLSKKIEVYEGVGNRRPKRIQMLLDKYKERGFEIFFQGDADGMQSDVLKSLIVNCQIPKENTFTFKYDFETSIPAGLMYQSLTNLGHLTGVSIDEFRAIVGPATGSINKTIKNEFGIDLSPIKIKLAKEVADILNKTESRWMSDKEFQLTELGRFLRFVQWV